MTRFSSRGDSVVVVFSVGGWMIDRKCEIKIVWVDVVVSRWWNMNVKVFGNRW